MSKEITKAIIIQEIQDKLKLRDFEASKFLFDETVVPVYNIEQHLEKWEVKRHTESITSAAYFTMFTVPVTEKWTIRSEQITFITGTYTIAGILLGRPTISEYMYLDLKAAQNVSYLVNFPVVVTAQPGEKIYVNVDGYTATGDFLLQLDAMVEKVR